MLFGKLCRQRQRLSIKEKMGVPLFAIGLVCSCGKSSDITDVSRLDLAVDNRREVPMDVLVRTHSEAVCGYFDVGESADANHTYSVLANSNQRIAHFWPCGGNGCYYASWNIRLNLGEECFFEDWASHDCSDFSMTISCDAGGPCAVWRGATKIRNCTSSER